jgi:hypothetical protein
MKKYLRVAFGLAVFAGATPTLARPIHYPAAQALLQMNLYASPDAPTGGRPATPNGCRSQRPSRGQ